MKKKGGGGEDDDGEDDEEDGGGGGGSGCKKKGGQNINSGLDMGRLFKYARNWLFHRPEGGFRPSTSHQCVDNQQHAFAVLTDFGDAPLPKLLEKSFQTVRNTFRTRHSPTW